MRTYRSPARLFAFGIVGILLILGAVDVMLGHWLSTPPEVANDVLTTRGRAQQRGDIVWGAALVGMGTLLVGGSIAELLRRRPEAEVTQTALVLAVGPHERDVRIEWGNVRSVSSDAAVDPYDGSVREHLLVDVIDRSALPNDPIGAVWYGNSLHVDAHDWTKPVTDVALSAQGALGYHRRVEEIMQMGPPSVEWEPTPDQGDLHEGSETLAATLGGATAATGGDVEPSEPVEAPPEGLDRAADDSGTVDDVVPEEGES
ncbi:MAG TPA: hypothetical protein VLA29_13085 [Acidimicrobiia bacterium]|nr:hypothetical protein [Acidimicrobiia bacterium]